MMPSAQSQQPSTAGPESLELSLGGFERVQLWKSPTPVAESAPVRQLEPSQPQLDLNLVAIITDELVVDGNEAYLAAVFIHAENRLAVVGAGDVILTHTVVSITSSQVVLAHGANEQILELDHMEFVWGGGAP